MPRSVITMPPLTPATVVRAAASIARSMATPAAVIFDNDGLLLDTESVWTRGEEDLFSQRGREFTPRAQARARRHLGARCAGRILARQLGEPGRELELVAELDELVFEELERGVEPMPGALELVTRAARARPADRRGLELAAAVHLQGDRAGRARGRFGRRRQRPRGRGAEAGAGPYLAACEQLGVTPAPEVIVLEDSPTGVAAGLAAGLTVIGVPSLDGVALDGAHEVHGSLTEPALLARLGVG